MTGVEQRRNETREAAIAFLEDYEHLAAIVAPEEDQQRSDLRRSSAIVRRMFIDGDLQRISSPRIGRLHIEAPDNKPYYVSSRKRPFAFFQSAGMTLFKTFVRTVIIEEGPLRHFENPTNPEERMQFSIESFLRQKVIYFQGNWMSRREIIKYVANVGSGVHSRESKNDSELRLARVRHVFSVSLFDMSEHPNRPEEMPADVGVIPSFNFNSAAITQEELPLNVDVNSIDCVLLEILAIMFFLVESPDVKSLCEIIREEASIP